MVSRPARRLRPARTGYVVTRWGAGSSALQGRGLALVERELARVLGVLRAVVRGRTSWGSLGVRWRHAGFARALIPRPCNDVTFLNSPPHSRVRSRELPFADRLQHADPSQGIARATPARLKCVCTCAAPPSTAAYTSATPGPSPSSTSWCVISDTAGYRVTYVRNFTDVDDKIINAARETGEDPAALADRYVQAFEEDAAALGLIAAGRRAAGDRVHPRDPRAHPGAARCRGRLHRRRRRVLPGVAAGPSTRSSRAATWTICEPASG